MEYGVPDKCPFCGEEPVVFTHVSVMPSTYKDELDTSWLDVFTEIRCLHCGISRAVTCRDTYVNAYLESHKDALVEECVRETVERYWNYRANRGKWIILNHENEFKCSKCGKQIYADDVNERNYCPSCGSHNEGRYT